ncbi:hypothetical protein [Nocardia jiangxiensis]|uniref:hypothetical protein n=1 Tax=Nocardia jiangxiensis TaxID=282685 RepID=UPI0002DF40BE|nr:hypothetical protein [Nocardia jiangxiensis]
MVYEPYRMHSRKGKHGESFVPAGGRVRVRDRGPRRPRSRRFYPHGYRSSNPNTVLGTLAGVVLCGAVLVLVLMAIAGRGNSHIDGVGVRLTAPPSATYTPPPCYPLQQPAC